MARRVSPLVLLLTFLVAVALESVAGEAECPLGGCDCPRPHGCVYPANDEHVFSGEEYMTVSADTSCADVSFSGVQAMPEFVAEGHIFFLLNAATVGVLAQTDAACFGSVAFAAALNMTPRAARVRMVSPLGRRVDGFVSARQQGGFVHLLILGERFHWSPVTTGFVRQINDVEMTTLSVSPSLFLVRSSKGSVLGWKNEDMIAEAEPDMHASGSRHYHENAVNTRTSKTAFLRESSKHTLAKRRVQSLVRLEEHIQVENLQVVKYEKGEHFRVHQDYFVHSEEDDYYDWIKWLKRKLKTNNATYIDAIRRKIDRKFNPNDETFSRTIHKLALAYGLLNEQDKKWVSEAGKSKQEFERRWKHMVRVSPLARLVRRSFASAVLLPELVMPDEPPTRQNRMATLFVYLNDEFEGGATGFTLIDKTMLPHPLPSEALNHKYSLEECNQGIQLRPRAGDGVLFYDLRADDAVEARSMHVACPPFNGIKYGANVWMVTANSKPKLDGTNYGATLDEL